MAVKHEIRTKDSGKFQTVKLTVKTAIYRHCLECVGFKKQEVEECPDRHCSLWPFRTTKDGGEIL